MADFAPAHPGEVLREDFLKPLDLSQYALAKAIDVPQIRVSVIVNGVPNPREATSGRLSMCRMIVKETLTGPLGASIF